MCPLDAIVQFASASPLRQFCTGIIYNTPTAQWFSRLFQRNWILLQTSLVTHECCVMQQLTLIMTILRLRTAYSVIVSSLHHSGTPSHKDIEVGRYTCTIMQN